MGLLVGRRGPYRELETRLGYRFRHARLLEEALTHPSYRFEQDQGGSDNQRLEFLGDAVLGFVAAAYLFEKHADRDEGSLTNLRSETTSGKALAAVARDLDLGAHIKMGRGEEHSDGRGRRSTLADALEAVVGAAYLDGGLKAVQKIFARVFQPLVDGLSGDVWSGNPKGKLQEYSQRRWKKSPIYTVVQREGPPHASVFTTEVRLDDGTKGVGRGINKQESEKSAAKDALERLSPRQASVQGD
jgi:ribonuclease III